MVKKRLFFWILLVVSVVCMIVGFGAKAKITDWPMCFILFGIPMFLTAVFRLCCFDEVERCFSKSTTLVTLGISAFGGSGLLFGFCMLVIVGFAGSDRHPIAGPVYTALTVISLLGFIMLIFFYAFLRSVHESRLGVFLDVVTSILYLPAFFWTIGIAFEQAEAIYRSLK